VFVILHSCHRGAVALKALHVPHPEVLAFAIIVHEWLPVWVYLRYPGLLPAGCHVLLSLFTAALPAVAVLLASCADPLRPRRDEQVVLAYLSVLSESAPEGFACTELD
jgi:hypothetical protein